MKDIKINQRLLVNIIGAIIVCGGIIFAYIYYFWFPIYKKTNALKKEIEKIEMDIDRAKKAKAKFGDLEQKKKVLEVEKANLEKKMPKDKMMQDLIKSIKKIADKHSIKIMSISPSSTVSDTYFLRVSYNFSAIGSYHNIGRFFAEISIFERILNIENVLISQGENSNVTFTLISYHAK